MTEPNAEPTEPPPGSEPAGRGEQTRRIIVDAAVRLFGELGYEKTTMRAIATAAGVSVGNAYYYFESKEDLVHELYLQIQRDHVAAVERLPATGSFADQLAAILRAGLATWAPYHSFAGRFIGLAAVPGSPLSPFSAQSAESREMALEVYRRFVTGTKVKMDPQIREALPEFLWLAQLGLVLYWVHDPSAGQERTQRIIGLAVPFVEELVGLSRMKVFRAMTLRSLQLLKLLNPYAAAER